MKAETLHGHRNEKRIQFEDQATSEDANFMVNLMAPFILTYKLLNENIY